MGMEPHQRKLAGFLIVSLQHPQLSFLGFPCLVLVVGRFFKGNQKGHPDGWVPQGAVGDLSVAAPGFGLPGRDPERSLGAKSRESVGVNLCVLFAWQPQKAKQSSVCIF